MDNKVESGLFIWLGYHFQDHWHQYALGIATPAFAVFGYLYPSYKVQVIAASIAIGLLYILGIIGQIGSTAKVNNLSRKIESQNAKLEANEGDILRTRDHFLQLLKFQLFAIYEHTLKLTPNERVTLFLKKDRNFILLDRHSNNTFYNNYGRKIYPLDKGCIGEALRNVECYIPALPDPNENIQEYINVNKLKWGLEAEETSSLSMKSRCFYALSIKSPMKDKTVGVIVFESTTPNGIIPEDIRKVFEAEERRFCMYIGALQELGFEPNYAAEEEF